MSKKILVDMDGIVADLATPWFEIYNKRHPDDILTTENQRTWDFGKSAKYKGDIYSILKTEGLYRELKPIEGSQDAIKAIQAIKAADGSAAYEVFFLTASITAPDILADKSWWVRHHFPNVPIKNFFTGYKKSMVKGDVFIDDSPRNMSEYRAAWPDAKILTIEYPYNEDVAKQIAAVHPSWKDPRRAWEEIVEYLKSLA